MTTPTATPPTAEQLTELRREIADVHALLRDIEMCDEAGTTRYRSQWTAEARKKLDAIYQTVRTMECEATG
jgi:hypothetical protein